MKKFKKYITENIRPPLLFFCMLFMMGKSIAQNVLPLSEQFKTLIKPGSTPEWISFWQDSAGSLQPATFFTKFQGALNLSADDLMTLYKTKKDEIGFTHYRYQQFYKSHRVVFGEYILHQQPDGILKSANGKLITGLKLGGTATVAENQALASALSFMNAGNYLWQNKEMEEVLKRQQNNPNATYYPKGELVYAPDKNDGRFSPSDYRLAWYFKIYPYKSNVPAKDVYVDALTGSVILSNDISMSCSGGSGTSAFNGTVSISTELSGGVYRSHNDCQATDIYVYNCNGGSASNTYYTSADNTWGATSITQSAVQAMWGSAMTYSYYFGEHGRQSWNGAAGDMVAYNNSNDPSNGINNSCWGCIGNNIILGKGSTSAATDDWNTNDIIGHEFTHGVTQSEAGLVYSNESGALNESFSDIFGEMVESWSEGNCDYLVGADRGAIRSFITPKTYGDPDTYKGIDWYTGSADHGGVHTNSGVQNHWFYLLSEGGSGTNDNNESFNVTAITRFKARLIAYRALTEYLISSSQYIDARKASLEAAYDLYGSCSPELISVGDAWHAVGVESQSSAYTVNACGNYPANGTFVQGISTVNGGNGCTTTITASSTTVYFSSRDKVILSPGFTAVNGSNFVAYLEPCSSTRWLTNSEPVLSDAEKGIREPVLQNAFVSPKSAMTNENANQDVIVTPNPFSGAFTVSINAVSDSKAQVIIYNSLGTRIKVQPGVNLLKGNNTLNFDGSNFAPGMYMLEVNFGDSKIVKKIIKIN